MDKLIMLMTTKFYIHSHTIMCHHKDICKKEPSSSPNWKASSCSPRTFSTNCDVVRLPNSATVSVESVQQKSPHQRKASAVNMTSAAAR